MFFAIRFSTKVKDKRQEFVFLRERACHNKDRPGQPGVNFENKLMAAQISVH